MLESIVHQMTFTVFIKPVIIFKALVTLVVITECPRVDAMLQVYLQKLALGK